MLEKHITFVADCDHCGTESLDTDETEFYATIDKMKREGWRIQKDSRGDWEHVCPCCQDDDAEDDFDDLGDD